MASRKNSVMQRSATALATVAVALMEVKAGTVKDRNCPEVNVYAATIVAPLRKVNVNDAEVEESLDKTPVAAT
ncbi:hypothetical protein NST47_07450 [Paenibacillus sp. FSL H8-0034]|uniref:hypothetical protein n=1 Tax=Paenibacillus sp. FSL H8-0034 TaxID=2954671 RepID=UPI0030F6E126